MTDTNFRSYPLSTDLLKAINMLNFKNPTEVQQKVIPAILQSKDVIVKSQTGSGKTAAFAIPITELVEWDENKPQGLVLAPTRELAIQIKEDFFNIGRFKRIKVSAIFGKFPFHVQQRELKQKTHVVVGTPGRIIDHLEKGTLDISMIKYLVIDEADEMLNMGFIEQIEAIIDKLPKERVTALLSATLPKELEKLCGRYMDDPIFVDIEDDNPAVDRIEQERYEVNENDKIKLLKDITVVENPDSCIVFCNTKIMVDEVHRELTRMKYTCEKIHGGMEQRDRLRVMNDFKQGFFRYLVATDVAARGIDIDSISLVINFDIPEDPESYVHRIGRTGRISKKGRAITFVTDSENKFLQEVHRYIGKEIPLKDRPKEQTVSSSKGEFIEKINAAPDIKEVKGAQLNQGIMKLHINAGKKTKMRPVDVVGTLCSIEGVTADDIGIINILDISTFVEVLNNKGQLVYNELQNKPIKGRIRRVSKVDRRKDGF